MNFGSAPQEGAVVPDTIDLLKGDGSVHETRVAEALADEHAEEFAAEMIALSERGREIGDGGEAYPPGVRELAERIAVDLEFIAKSLIAILRQVGPRHLISPHAGAVTSRSAPSSTLG
jgi:hypothetical protein